MRFNPVWAVIALQIAILAALAAPYFQTQTSDSAVTVYEIGKLRDSLAAAYGENQNEHRDLSDKIDKLTASVNYLRDSQRLP